MNQKIETLFRAALEATPEERKNSSDLSTGFDAQADIWEVIVKHTGNLTSLLEAYPEIQVIELLNNYGILRLPEPLVDTIAGEEIITYMEKPKRLFFELSQGKQAACINTLQAAYPSLTGRGTLVGIIDSGIDYSHPDFRNPDGSTRILELWDQSLGLFPKEVIDEALSAPTPAEALAICPSRDVSGHGTHVAGIAAGNGRASNGVYRGVAYEADLLVVKLGTPSPTGFPSTSLLMMAVDFCIRESINLNQPLALNLSFGNTYGSHSGTSLLETYLDSVSELGRVTIVVGSGNEGTSDGHIGGTFQPNVSSDVEISVSDFTPNLNIQFWKNYWDEVIVTLIPPVGNGITLPLTPGAWRYSFGETEAYVFNGEPTPYSPFQEIYLELLPRDSYISPGIWKIRLTPQRIRSGLWNMWLPSSAIRNTATGFLLPTPDTTLTIPSTASRVITVGAYDSAQNTIAPFSGRGFTWNNQWIKPDLVAPGVNIVSCAPGGGYAERSGTSMATPFVTGTASLLMQWGILEGNDAFLYGEKMRAYLINGTKPLPGFTQYPNPQTGWGALCGFRSLREVFK